MYRKVVALLAIIALFAGIVAGCGGSGTSDEVAKEPDVVRIGVFEPMTGLSAAGGQMTVEGIKLANKLYPEVLGKKVQLFIVDNKSDKAEAKNAVTRLIERDKVVAIIGSYGSSLSMAAGDTVKKARVPAVGCSPTNPLVTLNNDYYFRVCFIDPFQGTVMAKYAYNDLNARTAAIIRNVSQDYSVGLCKYFEDAFKKLTGDPNCIVATLDYQDGTQDFTAQLTTVQQKEPDVIFAPGNYGDVALLIKQARELGLKQPFLGGDTLEAPEFIQVGGQAVEGVVFSTHYSKDAPVTEMSKKFVEAYTQEYHKEPNAFAALGFDAYLVILDAIKRAGSIDSEKIRDALAETKDFEGATGIITFDENGDANKSAVILVVKNGEFKYLTTVNP
ncbi:MAG: Extracellular ligand-binding receptor [Thermoanaerobacterales bacterium 50_218]|nr:MAG: Extracellular ligand-binding receptor [Thermoanaerobacterales bacterium 50_218]HAA90642.1 branched-chain amino acid ABC transporter substrate-binding protein [Peptococcaceae bacterium]